MAAREPVEHVPLRFPLPGSDRNIQLELLGGFRLHRGATVITLPHRSQRLLAFLALRPGPVKRVHLAGTLWPESDEKRSNASLRSALFRLLAAASDAVDVTTETLALSDRVTVDLGGASDLAARIVDASESRGWGHVQRSVTILGGELLPDWYDDWVLIEAENWRQLRMHTLETLAGQLVAAERFAEAVAAGIAAVRAEPLRESARVALISAHLAEGNQSEALREYEHYHRLLRAELNLEPTDRLRDLLRPVRPGLMERSNSAVTLG